MTNEYPPPPTEMCEPVITGINKLHKAIDEYWESKYPTYAKGRIKRMRARREGRFVNLAKRVGKRAYSFSGDDYPYIIKRWNRH